jgi:hypothetical protein
MPLCMRKGGRHMGRVWGEIGKCNECVVWMGRKWEREVYVGEGCEKCHWRIGLWGCVGTCWQVVNWSGEKVRKGGRLGVQLGDGQVILGK